MAGGIGDLKGHASAVSLDGVVDDERWGGETSFDGLLAAIASALAAVPASKVSAGVVATVMFSNDAHVRQLNRDFRGFDKPTNVLSFPAGDSPELAGEDWGGGTYLGDVIVAYETVKAESEAQELTLEQHLTHLIVHGVLHLAGHDHEIDREAEDMEATEVAVLAVLGIADPYAA